ncbi:MAG TPA: hypothetical protein VK569_09630 [Bacteroidota bacterium]|nr:hypothetical protein [Bacteroidota bacterium]
MHAHITFSRLLPLMALCFLRLTAPDGALQAQSWTASYFHGLQALQKKQWDQAILQFSEAINAHPASQSDVHAAGRQSFDYYPYLYRGIAYYQSGDLQNARADLLHEDELGQVPGGALDAKAAQLLSHFLPLVKDLKRKGPFVEGMQLFNEKDYKGAIEKFSKVPATSPRFDEAKNFSALAQDEINKSAAASANAGKSQHAQRHEPAKPTPPAVDASSQTLYRDAVTLYDAGKLREAKGKFQELKIREFAGVDVEKYLADIVAVEERTLMGVTAYLEGDYALAITQLGSCARAESDNPHIYAFLAYSCAAKFLLSGRQDTALSRQAWDSYARLQRLAPSYAASTRFISPGIIAFLRKE